MRDRIMRAAGAAFCAMVAFMPVSALAFDVNKASSNFDLVSLSDAELSARSLKTVDMGNVELTSGHIVAADPLAQPDRPAFARTVPAGDYPVRLTDRDPLAPGALEVTKNAVHVGTGSGPVLLGDVRPFGKKQMPAADWARGARLETGARFA